jgi:hypothetical protein
MIGRIYPLAVFVGLLALGGCSAVQVNADFDPGTDFSRYQTFSFITDDPLLVADVAAVSPLLQGRLMRATQSELSAKGFRYTDDRANADLVVSFTLGARDKVQVSSYPGRYYGSGVTGWSGPYFDEVEVRNYTEGTLAVDLFDVKTTAPVWHGWAVKAITPADRENAEQLIKELIAAILEQFPPDADA